MKTQMNIKIRALCLLCVFIFFIPSILGSQKQEASLDDEINALSKELSTEKNLTVSVAQHFLGDLTRQLAKASTRDLQIKVLPGRLYSSQSDLGFAKYQNYLDLKGGDGAIDLSEATIEGIRDGRIQMLVNLNGQVKAQAQGKQIGLNYNATPDIGVSMRDRIAFFIEPSGGEFRLRPVAKQLVAHLDIGVTIDALGTKLNTSQDMPIDVAKFIQPIKLPNIVSPSLHLPGEARSIVLTNVGYQAENGKLRLSADLNFQVLAKEVENSGH
jgi:hypothetical protein